MLQKYDKCRGWWGISAGEVSRQARILFGGARHAWTYKRIRAYIRASKLEAGSCNLEAGKELKQC